MKESYKEILQVICGIVVIIVVMIGLCRLMAHCLNNDDEILSKGYHTITYTIYYPNNPRVITKKNVYKYRLYSIRGSNTLSCVLDNNTKDSWFIRFLFGENKVSGYTIYDGTAPVEVNSFVKQ